jgi:hypothetical protein
MSRARPFTQSDITRAIKGAVMAGVQVGRVEIAADKIIVIAGAPETAAPPIEPTEDLDRELAEFEAKHGRD